MPSSSFAEAQSRVLARQSARQLESQSFLKAQQDLILSSPLGRLPPPLNRVASPLSSLWSTLTRSEGTRPAFRVGQVDAELLDEELLTLLRGQIGEGLKYFGAHLQDEYALEIGLVLRAVLWKLSIWDWNTTYGASLQNLRYMNVGKDGLLGQPKTWQKGVYGLINVVGKYGWEKWEEWLSRQEDGYTLPSERVRWLALVTDKLATGHSIASLVGFVVFLVNGKYRTLTDRLLRLRLVPKNDNVSRDVSFEYLNRQLVWHAFTEFLLFLLPLVGINRWSRWLSKAWRRTKEALRSEKDGDEIEVLKQGPLAFLLERTCPICYQDQNPSSVSETEVLGDNVSAGGCVVGSATKDVVNPYETIPCACIYCFVCIATKIEAEEGAGWQCLRCGETVYKCRPWSGDVLVEKRPGSKNGKTVGFANMQNEEHDKSTIDPLDSELGSSQWTMAQAGSDSGG